MPSINKHAKLALFAAALTLSVNMPLGGTQSAMAADLPPAAVAGSSGGAGALIVGGMVVSVASIIACAMIVGSEEGREMTLEEAMLSGAVPLGCLLREHVGTGQ
jgi:hypothetical protein